MLEYILGRAGTGKSHCCLDKLREELSKNPLGPALVLLLPEHMTYKAERSLASLVPGGYMRCHVVGFRRLARQILLETGGAIYPRLSETGRQLLLKKILLRRQKDLSIFARAGRQRGFAAELAATIDELKSYDISSVNLVQAAKKTSVVSLQQKLTDLSLLTADFAAEMKGHYNDSSDMLSAATAKLPLSAQLQGAVVWIDGFTFFNPQEMKFLENLCRIASEVHITLAQDVEDMRENMSEMGLFHRQYRTIQVLSDMAKHLNIEEKKSFLPQARRYKIRALADIEKGMFRFPQSKAKDSRGVRIIEAANRRLEATAAAADMVRLCREKGYRWHDIGIVVREPEAYDELLELVLTDYSIPFFRDGKRRSVHHPLAELLRSSLEAVSGWRYEAIFRCLKTGFFPLNRSQTDRLENYVLAYGIHGKIWLQAAPWSYIEPDKLHREDIDKEESLAAIDFIRKKAVHPLEAYERQLAEAVDVRGQCRAVYDFLLALDVPGVLDRWSDEAEKAGRLAEAREHEQVWKAVVELLDQLVEIGGSEKISRRFFAQLLGEGLDDLQLSLIPPGLDYVTIASFDQNSLANTKAIYILGVNEGIMPRRTSSSGLLTDADRLHLASMGIEVADGASTSVFGEKYALYKGFGLAREYLWVSYAQSDGVGHGLNASSLLGSMCRMFGADKVLNISADNSIRQDDLLLASPRQALSGLANALCNYRQKQVLLPIWRDVYNWFLEQKDQRPLLCRVIAGLFAAAPSQDNMPPALTRQLYAPKGRLSGSVTRLESYAACPFKHFAKYGLHLLPRKLYSFQATELGVLLHQTMEQFGVRLKSQGKAWGMLSEEECTQLCGEIVDEIAPQMKNEILLSSAEYQQVLQRIKKMAQKAAWHMTRFAAVSNFYPWGFECSFGMGSGLRPLRYVLDENTMLELSGQIDRIDVEPNGRYFLIIDYKTGQTAFNLLDVYYGLRLQLLTYLLAAQEILSASQGKDVLPAGMLYCFLRQPLLTMKHHVTAGEAALALDKSLRMPGWVLADEEVVRQIDSGQAFIKVGLNKNGFFAAQTKKNIRTAEEFSLLLSYLSRFFQEEGRSIMAGTVCPQPYKLAESTACRYCDYQSVCGFDIHLEGYEYRKLDKVSDESIMARIKEKLEEAEV